MAVSVSLADVYATIAYYLRKRDEVDSYLRDGQAIEAKVCAEIDKKLPPGSIRERLLARRGRAGT